MKDSVSGYTTYGAKMLKQKNHFDGLTELICSFKPSSLNTKPFVSSNLWLGYMLHKCMYR